MDDRNAYLEEYSSDETVAKYVSKTAGQGIEYNLARVYGPVYEHIIDAICAEREQDVPFHVLEYGCGAGMNLLWITQLLSRKNRTLGEGIGADFSEKLVDAARRERESLPSPLNTAPVEFVVAANESLVEDLATQLARPREQLENRFELIVGVNTFRYVLRLGKQRACADNVAALLKPGGYSVMIDMNCKFPLFRTQLKDRLTRPRSQYWLPSLQQYAEPFESAGLEIKQQRNFCWVPHSARGVGFAVMRNLAPVLDRLAPSFAMRSLVVARKPASPVPSSSP